MRAPFGTSSGNLLSRERRGSHASGWVSPTSPFFLGGLACFPTYVAALLASTAALKVYQLATHAILETSWLASPGLVAAVALYEWLLAAWLISNLWRSWAWWATICTFCGFAAISLFLAARSESCGCFGVWSISPWISFSIDVLVVLVLVFSRRVWRTSSVATTGTRVTLSAVGLATAVSTLTLVTLRAPTIAQKDSGVIVAGRRTVVLEPERWLGKYLPILPFIDKADVISSGDWDALLYRSDCPECQRTLLSLAQRDSRDPIALIELPPFEEHREAHASTKGIEWMRASGRYRWIAKTPIKMRLEDGVVADLDSSVEQAVNH